METCGKSYYGWNINHLYVIVGWAKATDLFQAKISILWLQSLTTPHWIIMYLVELDNQYLPPSLSLSLSLLFITQDSGRCSLNSPPCAHFFIWFLNCNEAALKWTRHLAATFIVLVCSCGSAPLYHSSPWMMEGSWVVVKSRRVPCDFFTLSRREFRAPHTSLTVETCLQAYTQLWRMCTLLLQQKSLVMENYN